MGTLSTNPEGQRVLLNFNTLVEQHAEKSLSISAVAIDPNTSRTAFSSITDNHIFERYSVLFASSFMSGFSSAVSQSGATTVQNDTSGTKSTFNPTLTTKEKSIIALGHVGTKLGTQLEPLFNRSPTVHVRSGTSMGILFVRDIALS